MSAFDFVEREILVPVRANDKNSLFEIEVREINKLFHSIIKEK